MTYFDIDSLQPGQSVVLHVDVQNGYDADDDTLRFFHANINSAHVADHGLIFAIVESLAADYSNSRRGFRFVAFDLFGTVLNDRDSAENLASKSDKATKDMWAFLNSFDALAHYKTAMLERAARLRRESDDMAKAAKALKV